MSRIVRTRVDAGDTTDATELNNTYSDYSQSGALDAPNTRDQAFDLPHFTNAPLILNSAETHLGSKGLNFTPGMTVTVSPTLALGAIVNNQIVDSGGLATFLNLSADPWTMQAGDVLRVWWDLSVSPSYTGTPWRTAPGSLGRYPLEDTAGGPDQNIPDGMHCWLLYLEWDITSAGLTDWVPVPNQTSFGTSFMIDSVLYQGGYVNQTASTSAVSCWAIYSFGQAEDGQVGNPSPNEQNNKHGFYAVSGMWAHPAGGSFTVYGVRVKVTGVFHPIHLNGGNSENILVYDTVVANAAGSPSELTYAGGRISGVHMRGS